MFQKNLSFCLFLLISCCGFSTNKCDILSSYELKSDLYKESASELINNVQLAAFFRIRQSDSSFIIPNNFFDSDMDFYGVNSTIRLLKELNIEIRIKENYFVLFSEKCKGSKLLSSFETIGFFKYGYSTKDLENPYHDVEILDTLDFNWYSFSIKKTID